MSHAYVDWQEVMCKSLENSDVNSELVAVGESARAGKDDTGQNG